MDHLPQRSEEGTQKLQDIHRKGRKRPSNLREQVDEGTAKMWPTPKANASTGKCIHGNGGIDLQTAVQMYPTPAVHDSADRTAINPIVTKNNTIRHQNKAGGQSRASLSQVVKMLPTPTSREWKGARTPKKLKQVGKNERNSLCDAIAATESGQLNPNWVDWLMGLPPGWTDITKEIPTPEYNPHHFDIEPDIPRVASGIKNRVARLTLDGNGVVPQQFYPFFAAIAEIERGCTK